MFDLKNYIPNICFCFVAQLVVEQFYGLIWPFKLCKNMKACNVAKSGQ